MVGAGRLEAAEIEARLSGLDGWQVVEGLLHREFRFPDFRHAFSFMTAVALEAEHLDHHPDWSNSWNRVTLDIVSHQAGGITEACFALAGAAERHARRSNAASG